MRIGELAALVGISTRAVRHYHRVGLLPEPARRANGYRSYTLRDAVALARVRRLVELGLSLGEVAEVLAGDADRDLGDILRELDADLAAQEAEIRRRRERLGQLLGQAEPVSPGLARLFTRLARPGEESRMAAQDRDVLAVPGPARPATGVPRDALTTAFTTAFFAHFAPAQSAAIRRAIDLMRSELP